MHGEGQKPGFYAHFPIPAEIVKETRFLRLPYKVLTTDLEHFQIEGHETAIQLIGCCPVNHA